MQRRCGGHRFNRAVVAEIERCQAKIVRAGQLLEFQYTSRNQSASVNLDPLYRFDLRSNQREPRIQLSDISIVASCVACSCDRGRKLGSCQARSTEPLR